MLQSANRLYRRAWHFWGYTYSERFDIRALFVLFANIFYNFRRGLTQQQCIDELNWIFGDEAPSRTSVYRWYGEFKWGCSSLQDEFRKGHPKSIVVPETIDAVHQLILQGCHVTYRKIETTLGISRTSIHSILHEHLIEKKNFFLRCFPHNLSKAQKNRSNPQKYKRQPSY